jgi:hypothetical protein
MKVRLYTNKDRSLWNHFVETAKNSHFMFHRDYMEYHEDRFTDFSLIVSADNDELLAVLPANLSNKILFSHQGLSFGGLCIQKNASTSLLHEIFKSIINFLKETNQIESFIYKRLPDFYTTYPSQEDLYSLYLLNAKLFRRDVTVAIDCQSPLPVCSMRMRRIKKAQKLGIYVEEVSSLSDYWKLLEEVLIGQHGVKPVHSLSEIERLRDSFPDNIRCFSAKKDGELISGTLVYVTPSVAHTQYLASSSLGRELGGLDLLIYELINKIFASKKFFDFGISTEDSGRTLNTGLISWKEGFGARAFVHDFYSIQVI